MAHLDTVKAVVLNNKRVKGLEPPFDVFPQQQPNPPSERETTSKHELFEVSMTVVCGHYVHFITF